MYRRRSSTRRSDSNVVVRGWIPPTPDHLETSPGGSAELMEANGRRLELFERHRHAGRMATRYGMRVWLALVTVYLVWGSTFIALAIVDPRPAAVSSDVDSASRRRRRAARVRASTRRSRCGSDRPAAGGCRVHLRRVAVRDGAWLAGVVPADGARRRGRAPRGDDPDLDGSLRPRRVRKASRDRCLPRHRCRLRRAGVSLRPVRRGIGRSRRRSRDRRERDVLGDRISVFTRRAASQSPSRVRRPRLALRRHSADGLLRRLGRDRRGDVDERRAPRTRLSHRGRQLRRFHRLRVAAPGRPRSRSSRRTPTSIRSSPSRSAG